MTGIRPDRCSRKRDGASPESQQLAHKNREINFFTRSCPWFSLVFSSGQNIIGPNATITINGCRAGEAIRDYYAGFNTSIAQQLANVTRRKVLAFKVGMYFSQKDAAHDTRFAPKKGDITVGQLPLYLVPIGPPGHKPNPTAFIPQ